MDPQIESGSSLNQSSLPEFETTHDLLNSSTFLLHLIEPVRIYTPPSPSLVNLSGTGRKSDDNNSSEKLKRRLIDALAFICATEREGDSGAAVCIEEAITPEAEDDENLASENGEYTLRIAKNGWVGEEVLQGLRDIMKSLETFADGSPSSSPSVSPAANLYQQIDTQVYSAIISLHLSKVLYHLSEIREPITVVQEALVQHLSAGEDDPQRIAALSALTASELKKLQTWLRSFVAQVIAADEAGEKRIPINAVSAAYQVRRSPVFGHLELLCKSVGCQVVGVHMIKLGRYKAACRTLMHACQKWPGMFVGMKVEGVPEVEDDVMPHINLLPRPTREMEIRRTLTEIINGDEVGEAAVEEGVQALLPTISEEQFATAWAARVSPYTGHAEVRLVEFYEENRKSRPISGSTDPREREVRYIGMSKKPCYLCQMFVDRHPARYMLGGLEGEKPGAGVKRVLDPYWRLRPVGGTEYARILDEMREAVEQELRAEVEKWVIRGSDEEVLGRERPRGRARAKGKRVLKRGKPKLEPETSSSSNASSSDGGGMSLTAEGVNGNPSPSTGTEGLKEVPEQLQGSINESASASAAPIVTETVTVATVADADDQVRDAAAVSEDEGEGVKLVHSLLEEGVAVAENTAPVETQLASAPEEVPDLIFPTAETDVDAIISATNFLVFSPPLSPPLPNLIDDEPEFLPLASAILSAGEVTSITDASSGSQTQYPVAEPPPISPTSGEFHSEMQFFEESGFKLLSPIPEEDDETLVLVNLDAVLVRLADLEQESDTAPRAEEVLTQATKLPQRARAMSDAERDLLGLDFTFVVAEEPETENLSKIFEAPPLLPLEEQMASLAPGGYLVPEDLEEGSSIAPGGYFVAESSEDSKEFPSGGYFVVAAEQAGVALPGGYLAAEAKLKEAGAFAPGGYLVAEMKGEVEIATLIQDENAETQSLAELPELAICPGQETIVSMEELGILAPGGYMVAAHDEGTLVAPGGYFVVPSEEQMSSPPLHYQEQEESGPLAVDIPSAEELGILAPGGYIVTVHDEGTLVAPGGYFVVPSEEQESSPPLHHQEHEESGALSVNIPSVEEGVAVELQDTNTPKEADVATNVAVNSGNEGSEDTEEGYDVINMEQEREKKPLVTVAAAPVAKGTAQPLHGDVDGDAELAVPDQSINANADAQQGSTVTSAVQEPKEPHVEFSSSSPIVVPTAEKLGSMVAGSPDAVHVTSNLGSSPSSSTHTTLSTSTTLANNSHPTTPRLRSTASLLFAPSLRRASTWASPTTATTMANTPAITSSLSDDVVLLPDSRPGTALGDHMEDGKPVEIRPVGSGGWLAKRLMRAANTANGVNGSTATDMEASGDGPDILPRRGSFSSTRPSTANGGALSGTAKALITLRALQVQVRQKK